MTQPLAHGLWGVLATPFDEALNVDLDSLQNEVASFAADGCDVAILQSSEMGRPIYERLGYRTVVEYDGWIDPAEAKAAP